ncbi:MAG: SpoVR family protein [Planctomycetota bacterium]|nr:MAG: SpoVR family protein [Planctomycetota bacterium]
MHLKRSLPAALKYEAVRVEEAARKAGLDGYEVEFELLPPDALNAVAAYGGFPVRYPSWRFGMEYERLEKGHRWGLSRIYELVVNNDPAYAYLVSSNSRLEQKLVMAHVFGHADFFKHNVWFAPTDRRMLDTLASDATKVRRAIDRVGQERVERFIDRVLSIETLIDPYLPLREMRGGANAQSSERAVQLPTYDLLGFLCERAPLEPFEREVLGCLRREAYYFAPQRMTKVMNEGWASYWHSRLLTGGLLEPAEIVDFADCHSSATVCAPGRLNPYKLGIECWRAAEARGLDLFALRRVHNDVTFLDELVDDAFLERELASCGGARLLPPREGPPDYAGGKARLLQELSWGGLPQIGLVAVGAEGEGELLLAHRHDGRDLQLAQARETLKALAAVWGGPVHLMTIENGQGRRLVATAGEVKTLETRDALRACA